MNADDPVVSLEGIGPAIADKLANLGIHRVADLLWHRPLRYEDRTHVVSLASLRPGLHALIVARIEHAEVRHGRRRSLLVSVTDGSGRLRLRFFHFADRQLRTLQQGAWVRAFGEARAGPQGLEMVHPEYRVTADRAAGEKVAPTLTPVYPTTQGVTQMRLRNLVGQALQALERPGFLPELLPEEIRTDRGLMGLHAALRTLHAPPPDEDPAALAAGDLARLPVEFLAVSRSRLTGGLLRGARRRGVEVHVWTLNTASAMVEAIQDGADGIITDRPRLAVRVRDELYEMPAVGRLLLRFGSLAIDAEDAASPMREGRRSE
jgi:RecG-like helicase